MKRQVAWAAAACVAAICARSLLGAAPDEHARSGGDATVFDTTRNAFTRPVTNLSEERRAAFFVGNSFFNQNWIIAPASVEARDGLGPLFNARSCSSCHFKDGRSRPPLVGEPMTTMLLRISAPGTADHGAPRPDPIYGDQIQGSAIPGVTREADVVVAYSDVPGSFADGEPYSLRVPTYSVTNLGYGPMSAPLMSPRVAPAVIGLGLLESVPAADLERMADPDDRNGDGISGRPNVVWNRVTQHTDIGRFGWKAEQPSVLQQSAAAFAGDIGITSTVFPRGNHGERQSSDEHPSGGKPEVSDDILRAVVLYARTLAVPAARRVQDPRVERGRRLFADAGCAACHAPELRTGASAVLPELAEQTIRPYSDLLLHDMGPDLADDRPTFAASGREWRTAPLWGLGLIEVVNGHTFLLHDGRARNVTEAILWHGGEALASRERFRHMPKPERDLLLEFLRSL